MRPRVAIGSYGRLRREFEFFFVFNHDLSFDINRTFILFFALVLNRTTGLIMPASIPVGRIDASL
jgi:hypothetical protein